MKIKLENFIIYSVLFIYGLFIPKISFLIIMLYGFYRFIINIKRIILFNAVHIILLFGFIASYILIGIYYSYLPLYQIQYIFLYIIVYIVAITLNLTKIDLKLLILSLLIGVFIFAFISSYKTYFSGNLVTMLLERKVVNIWTDKYINSTIISVDIVLFFSIALLSFLKRLSFNYIFWIYILLIGGIIMMFLFKTRGPILSLVIIFLIIFIYFKVKYRKFLVSLKYIVFLIIIFIYVFFNLEKFPVLLEIINAYSSRLNEIGLESDRYRLWILGLENFFSYPLGGKEYNLEKGHYLHNMILDINYETGLLPIIFLFIFYSLHIKYLRFFLKTDYLLLEDKMILFLFGLGSLIPTFFEPIMQGNIMFFTYHIFFLGLVKNYYDTFRRRKN